MDMTLAQMSWPQAGLTTLIIVVCVLLMIVILLQRGRGGGLSGAFGGGGGSAAFGAKTGDVFTWITVSFTAVFVLLTVVANFAFDESAVPPPEEPEITVPVGDGEPTDDLPEGIQAVELKGTPVEVPPADTKDEEAPAAQDDAGESKENPYKEADPAKANDSADDGSAGDEPSGDENTDDSEG